MRLSDDQLQMLNAQEKVKKSISLRDVRSLQRIDCGIAKKYGGEREQLEQCTVRYFTFGELTIKSASWAGPNEWDSHGSDYHLFVSELMDAIARCNPSAKLILGSAAIVMIWRALQGMGVLLAVIGIVLLTAQELRLALVAVFVGIGLLGLGSRFVKVHRQTTSTIQASLAADS